MWSRSLHADYPSSASYQALFHAGLLLSEVDHVDMLVTGLPVSQYLDEKRRHAIAEQMKGSHQVTPKRSISVDAVKVIPQPVGGFLDFIAGGDADVEGARVLVIDPGFFSVDWVVIADSDLHRQSSNVSTEKLENAIRGGKAEVLVLGKRVDLGPYIEQASRKVAPVVVESIQKSLRKESESVDRVLLVGGGAPFFKEALSTAFAQLTVVTTKDPVFSNARGFWLMGASL
jgi:plasmid segregation protein ParM